MRPSIPLAGLLAASLFAGVHTAEALTHEVGPGKTYANVGDVPWESLNAGDTVLIYHRATPYKEKFVLSRVGTPSAPIIVRGCWDRSASGPFSTGTAPPPGRSSITTAGTAASSRSADPRSPSPTASPSCRNGSSSKTSSDTIATRNVLLEGNYIYDNGNTGSNFEHNVYTEALGITFQYNHLGPLRAGASGNNLKDRSAGLLVRYNWIEGGNRQGASLNPAVMPDHDVVREYVKHQSSVARTVSGPFDIGAYEFHP